MIVKLTDIESYGELFSLIRAGYSGELNLDISRHPFIEPKHVVLLAELIIKLVDNECKIHVQFPDDSKIGNYLKDIGIIDFINTNYQQPKNIEFVVRQTAMPIRRIERDTMDEYINLTARYLQEHCPGKDLTFLNIALAELINNVHDHSRSPIGAYVFSQFYPNIKKIKLAVCDLGIGISKSVNDHLTKENKPVLTAEDTIRWAFIPSNSAKSIPQNRGVGLPNILEFVKGNHSRLELYTNNTYMIGDNRNLKFYNNPIDGFMGTLVEIWIDIPRLEDLDEALISEELW